VTFNVFPTTAALPVGTYTATVVIGTGTANGSVISIRDATVSYVIGDITVSQANIILTAPASNTPSPAVQISVSSTLGAVPLFTTVNYLSGPGNWLTIVPDDVNHTTKLDFSGNALPTGTYNATVILNDSRSSVQVNVTYTVP
jgi:hypothetical protein